MSAQQFVPHPFFEIGQKYGFYDSQIKIEDWLIPIEYKGLRDS